MSPILICFGAFASMSLIAGGIYDIVLGLVMIAVYIALPIFVCIGVLK